MNTTVIIIGALIGAGLGAIIGDLCGVISRVKGTNKRLLIIIEQQRDIIEKQQKALEKFEKYLEIISTMEKLGKSIDIRSKS